MNFLKTVKELHTCRQLRDLHSLLLLRVPALLLGHHILVVQGRTGCGFSRRVGIVRRLG